MRTHRVLGETRSVVGLMDGDVYINNNTAMGAGQLICGINTSNLKCHF